MWAIFPWALAIGFAAFTRFFEGERRGMDRKRSIEFCVGNCSAMWLAEDGVLRVYAERTDMECYRLVVDCGEVAPNLIPGEIDGWPVRIRMAEGERADQRAGRLFARRAVAMGYELRPTASDGQVSTVRSDGAGTTVLVEGAQISNRLVNEARRVADENGILSSIETVPPMGPFGHPAACIVRFSS